MKNVFLRSLSALLAFITVFGMLAGLSMIPVFAADETGNESGTVETVELTYEERLQKYYLEGIDYDEEGNEIDVD